MAFPGTPLDVAVGLRINGAWVNITSDVLVRDGITITRGKRDEGSRSDPGRCSLSIKNTNGKYSPRNPNSPYYGLIGRNTQIVVWIGADARFIGEVSAWPPRWDLSGNDVWVPIEAAGILRRLGSGAAPFKSVLYRALTTLASNAPVAYWPCEDDDGSTRFASAFTDGQPLSFSGAPDLGGYDGFAASDPIPLMKNSQWSGVIPSYGSAVNLQVRFLLSVPAAGATVGASILSFKTSGTAAQWTVFYAASGSLRLVAYDVNGNSILDTTYAAAIAGKPSRISVELTQAGNNIGWDIIAVQPGATVATHWPGTLTNRTVGRALSVAVNSGGLLDDTAIGHISVQPEITSAFDLIEELDAFAGEAAGFRIQRLCAEEGIVFFSYDNLQDTPSMGAQRTATLIELLSEAAETDMGALFEPRDYLGLEYRTRTSMYNQAALVELDYEAGHLAPPLEPIDDDQGIVNDVTVTRVGGSSARASLATGPMSTMLAPDGIGLYNESVTVNVETDSQLPDQAGWRVHLGTVDEARYPQIRVNLASEALSSNAALTADMALLSVADRLTIVNQPAWLPPGTISQTAWGFTEILDVYGWDISVNCSPASPYEVGVYDTSRYDTAGSTTVGSLTSTASLATVTTPLGPPWICGEGYLRLNGAAPAVTASTPDTAALDIIGDLDIRVRLSLDTWTSTNAQAFVGKGATSYSFGKNETDFLRIEWYDGAVLRSAVSTVTPGFADGSVHWVRVTLDVNNGATGRTIVFYTSEDGTSWTQLGASVVQAGTTAIGANAIALAVGTRGDTVSPMLGNVYYVEVRNGLSGTVVTNPDFSAQSWAAASFADGTGKTWTIAQPSQLFAASSDFPFDVGINGERLTVTDVQNATSPQIFTVTRSINGVAKAHSSGAYVSLWDKATRAL